MRARLLLVALLLGGCVKPSPCRRGTLLVTVQLDGAAAAASSLAVTVQLGGVTRKGAPIAHRSGTGGGTIEVDFAAGYPAGQTVTLAIDALDGTRVVGRGAQTLVLPAACASVTVALHGGAVVDLGGSDGSSDGGTCDATTCPAGYCADGVCCDRPCSGQCEACDLPGSVGTCTPVSGKPRGQRPGCNGAGTVCGGQCDGQNRTGCAYPPTSTACGGQSCSGGAKTLASTCDGAGSCNSAVVLGCTPPMCNSAGSDCASTCASDAACAPFAGKPYCDHGVCTAHLPDGRACKLDGDCNNGHCVDGYCCDRGCDGACEACDVSGSVGTCSPVTSGAPHGLRAPCGGSGMCQGSCAPGQTLTCTPSSVQCAGGSCTSGVDTPPVYCSNGGCPSVATAQCASGLACTSDGTACRVGACASDADCQLGYFCAAGGTCKAQVAAAGKCNLTADCASQSNCRECASGFCADGVCCDQKCDGQCQACDVSGSAGSCLPVSGAPHGGRPGCGGSGVCAGSCNGSDASRCTFPTVSCTAQSCSGGVVTLPSACDQGACVAPVPPTKSCAAGQICSGDSCSGCTADSQCASNQFCDHTGSCVPRLGSGLQCGRKSDGSNPDCYGNGNCAECLSTFCVDGVCCGTVCDGQCQNCKTNPGSCTFTGSASAPAQPISDGSTARAACPGSGTCQMVCDGSAATCVNPSQSKVCVVAGCVNGIFTAQTTCSGDSCPKPVTTSCAPYNCKSDGSACLGACTRDSDCQIGHYCDATGHCVTQKGQGATCGLSSSGNRDCYANGDCAECASGNCVSGFCCDSVCGGACQACDASNNYAAGKCHPIAAGSKPPACGTAPCGGSCDGVNGDCTNYPAGNGCLVGTACGYCSQGSCVGNGASTCGGICCAESCACMVQPVVPHNHFCDCSL